MLAIINTKVTYIWLLLAALTGISWLLADGYQPSNASQQLYVSCALLLLAFFKIRLVVMYFMEVIDAPWGLRGLFEAWVILVCSIMIFLYLNPGALSGLGGL